MVGPKIVVTGGSGCLGVAIVQCLRTRLPNASIFVLDISLPSIDDNNTSSIEYHQVDVCDASAVSKLITTIQPQVIVHTAALIPSAAKRLGVGDAGLRKVNVDGTRNVLDAAKTAGSVVAFVHTSSCDVVKGSSWMDLRGVDESTAPPQTFDDVYAESKAIGENMVLSSASPSFKTTAIRTCGIIGPNETNILPLMAAIPRRISLGKGTNLFDFTSAENVALGHVLAIENLLSSPGEAAVSANGKAFFVTDQRPIPMRRLTEMIWECLDYGQVQTDSEEIQAPPFVIPVFLAYAIIWSIAILAKMFGKSPMLSTNELGDSVSERYFDNSLAKDVLGYVPEARLEDSIRDACRVNPEIADRDTPTDASSESNQTIELGHRTSSRSPLHFLLYHQASIHPSADINHYPTGFPHSAQTVMPTYLLHGFRWPRPLIRIHIILQNLDDAAAEWLMAPQTGETLMTNFTTLYPEIMPSLPDLRFIEQYDPTDERTESKSQPYAYVADTVHEIKLGVDVDEVRGRGVGNEAWTSMVELRDKLAPGEKVAWFVVVCGDVERWAPPTEAVEETNGFDQYQANGGSVKSITSYEKRSSQGDGNGRPPTSKTLSRFFSMKSLRKSKR
ncbi:hypothetical protein FKW77_004245 [Venturia effusa]|uniref:3-beta hydroxysteroid dehydrogenase/isomerase domain-containing protein n=1 Tax=Venturia effusa TaxID=50376 RepID=A0A517LR83_9PEZI|nr:hypothetical protein FKW77_004245 [Venturia effusa]